MTEEVQGGGQPGELDVMRGDTKYISIGALSKETGLSVENLRMWERRYGSPKAIRLPSGHRRYTWAEVARLKLVVSCGFSEIRT